MPLNNCFSNKQGRTLCQRHRLLRPEFLWVGRRTPKQPLVWLAILLIVLVVLHLNNRLVHDAIADSGNTAGAPPQRIAAKDICDGRYEIIGLLGKPYGSISRIGGVWEGERIAKVSELSLRITEIDGKGSLQTRKS